MEMNVMKRRIHICILFIVMCLTVMGICGCGSKEEAYRLIKIMALDGTAKVTRENVGELDAYVDMRLESGDALAVADGSSLVLNLDDDKYVLLESGTKMNLEAEGDSVDSRTVIHLTEGAVVNELLHTLTEDSSYEVMVPNSTMAVRGTVFRVAIGYDGKGDSYAVVTVLEGKVASRLIFPDGTVQPIEEEREVPTGMQVQVHGNKELSEYYPYDLQPVDLKEYSLEALNFLELCLERGAELSVSEEEILERIEELMQQSGQPESTKEESILEEDGTELKEKAETPPVKKQEINENPEKAPTAENQTAPADSSNSSSGSSSGGSSNSSSGSSSGSSQGSSGSGGSTTAKTCAVTFMYNGAVFCTQSVEKGNKVSCPTLQPTASGSWNYNFDTAVNQDTTIEWISN